MCQYEPGSRVRSFLDIEKTIQNSQFYEIDFTNEEMQAYRVFSDAISSQISKIENGAKYVDDPERLRNQLSNAYRTFMLEEFVPDAAVVLRQLIVGNYYYYKKRALRTDTIRDFVRLMKSVSTEKLRILIANLHTRFDSIERFTRDGITDDDVRF
jgi:hypothetical protein